MKHAATNQLERKVDIAKAATEQRTHQQVVEERIHHAHITLARSVEAVRGNNVGFVLIHQAHCLVHFTKIEWQVGVGVQHHVASCSCKARLDRPTKFAVYGVMHHHYSAVCSRCLVGKLGRCIGRSIIDNDHLVVGNGVLRDQLVAKLGCGVQRSLQVFLFVPHGEKDGKLLKTWARHPYSG